MLRPTHSSYLFLPFTLNPQWACRDARRLDVYRKPDGTPPDLPRRADLLVYEVSVQAPH